MNLYLDYIALGSSDLAFCPSSQASLFHLPLSSPHGHTASPPSRLPSHMQLPIHPVPAHSPHAAPVPTLDLPPLSAPTCGACVLGAESGLSPVGRSTTTPLPHSEGRWLVLVKLLWAFTVMAGSPCCHGGLGGGKGSQHCKMVRGLVLPRVAVNP